MTTICYHGQDTKAEDDIVEIGGMQLIFDITILQSQTFNSEIIGDRGTYSERFTTTKP
jgi:hypothetical protein